MTDGDGSALTGVGGGLQSQQTFTSAGSATWTKPTGITKIKVYVTGGGGGGGGARDTGTAGYDGASGGAGGTAIKIIDVTTISSVAITIGAGGSGGATGSGVGASGSSGSTTSFGTHCSATSGTFGYGGGAGSRRGGHGGVGVNGDINLYGCGGGNSGDTGAWSPTNAGASSFWGGAGHSAGHLDYTTMSSYHGAGGSGGYGYIPSAGLSGGSGMIVVEEYR